MSFNQSNLPDFEQLNASTGQAFGRSEGEMARSYEKLGIPLSSSAAQRDMGFGIPLLTSAVNEQNLQQFAQAQNAANAGMGKGTGGFGTGFNIGGFNGGTGFGNIG